MIARPFIFTFFVLVFCYSTHNFNPINWSVTGQIAAFSIFFIIASLHIIEISTPSIRVSKLTDKNGIVSYQIQQRHNLLFTWCAAWENSSLGANAPTDTFSTLEAAIEGLKSYNSELVDSKIVYTN